MYFAQPWGLLALLSLPAILLIHLYQRRFPPLPVAGLHLWSAETRQQEAGRRREKLPLSRSLLLELLAALLLSLVLSEPHFGDTDRALHLVAVLDNSGSMSARPPGTDQLSFRDSAVAELERRIARLPRSSAVTLILTGARPEVLGAPLLPLDDACKALRTWQPNAPRHAFDSAWDLGLQLSEQAGESGALLFLTDRVPADPSGPAAMEVVAVGQRLENVAISAAQWTFDPVSGVGKLYVRVENHGTRPADAEIRGVRGEQVLFRRKVSLPLDGAAVHEAQVPGGLAQLAVEVTAPEDGLALDNRVELIEPKVRRVTVANLLPKQGATRFLERVLSALPNVQFGAAASADLTLAAARDLPEPDAHRWWLGVGPLSREEGDLEQSKDLAGPYVLEKGNPLLAGVALGGVVWGGVQPVPLEVTPLISAGNYPLLSRLDGTRTTAYLLNIDLARSNLPDSPDWPILISNLIEARRADLPGLTRWNYKLGEEIRCRFDDRPGQGDEAELPPLELVHRAGTKELPRGEMVAISAPRELGVYEIQDAGRPFERFAVNFFDPDESELRPLGSGRRGAKNVEELPGAAVGSPYSWAILAGILLVLAAMLADWRELGRLAGARAP